MGLFSSIGGLINDITGASSSAKQSYKYSAALASQNAAYQKEFAQNAHQWEIEDLKKAGLNPILSAGGSGASASGGGGAAITAQNGAGGLSSIMNSAASLMRLSSEIDNLDSNTNLQRGQLDKVGPEIQNINADTSKKIAETKNVTADTMLKSAKQISEKGTKEYALGKAATTSAKKMGYNY